MLMLENSMRETKAQKNQRIKDAFSEVMKAWKKIEKHMVQIVSGADYDAYLKHHKSKHPDKKPLSPNEFYKMVNDNSDKRQRC